MSISKELSTKNLNLSIMKKLMMLAAMAIFCVSMNAQEPQKKECCKKEKTECCDKKDKKEWLKLYIPARSAVVLKKVKA